MRITNLKSNNTTILAILILIYLIGGKNHLVVGSAVVDIIEYQAVRGGHPLNREQCVNMIHGSRWNTLFTHYIPNSVGYNKTGFRGYDANCDPDLEEDLFKQLLAVAKNTSVLPGEDIPRPFSNEHYMTEWGNVWNRFYKDATLSKKICNPQWFLECSPKNRKCVCRTTGMTDFEIKKQIKMVRENVTNEVWDASGSKITYIPGHRCVAAESPYQGHHDWNWNGCDYYFPPINRCMVNCQLGAECMSLTHKVTGYPLDFRVCCDKNKKCEDSDEKDGAQSWRGSSWIIVYVLFGGAINLVLSFHETFA